MSTTVDVVVPQDERAAELNAVATETPAPVSEHLYKYKVKMTCGGCSGAVTRVLQRAKDEGQGVDSFEVSLENQSVVVSGAIGFDELTTKIAKTGKQILEKEEVTAQVSVAA